MKRPRTNGLRVLIAEDHATTRLGIKQILLDDFRRITFGEASDARRTLELLGDQPWDLLILDVGLPDVTGLEALRSIKRAQPLLPVLIYSVHPQDQFGIHAARAGAAGYLTKERAPEELCRAVRALLAGEMYLGNGLADRLAGELELAIADSPHERLSHRELQVFRLTSEGRTGKEIAYELGLSPKTVSTYRKRVLDKLSLGSTAEMIHYAAHHRLR